PDFANHHPISSTFRSQPSVNVRVMANNDVIAWTASQVQSLLPGLEGPYLQEAVKYSLSLPAEDTNRHWRSLLGSAPQVDNFLKSLNERRNPPDRAAQQAIQTP